MSYFERTTPEAVGMHSKSVLRFIKYVEDKNIELHSLMIIRHGKCCASGWWAPYGPEYLHPMCSFSKSVTSIAVGFAEQEGLLRLEEKIADIFPEYLPENPTQELMHVQLQHLLTMSCGHDTETEAMGEDWIREFLSNPFRHEPGTFFRYNTAGTNMLAAVLKKKTGQNVTEYLRPRLLDPLGIRNIFCDCLPGPEAVEIGGGAMKLCTEDMAKIAYFLLKKGMWEGKQLLRESWFERACSKQIETKGDADGHVGDWACGYGYQFWMCAHPKAFRADGAFGQFGIVFPDLNMIVVTTAATEQTQELMDSIQRYFIPETTDDRIEKNSLAQVLEEKLSFLNILPLQGKRQQETEARIHDRIYFAEESEEYCSSMEILVGGVALYHVEEGKITKMSFTFSEDMVTWNLWEGEERKQLMGDFRGRFQISRCGDCLYGASAGWSDENTLQIEIRRLDAISGARINFRFEGNRLTLDSQDTLLTGDREIIGMRMKHTVPFLQH